MHQDFDSDFDLPHPTKVKFAKRAGIVGTVVVTFVGVLLSFALDSLKAALANVAILPPSVLSFPMLLLALLGLFVVIFLGAYYAQYQRAKNFIDQLSS